MLNIKIVKPKPKQYKIAYASLAYINDKKPKKITRSISITPLKNRDKWDDIIDKAIMKGILDESERDITKSELSILSEEELNQYIQNIENSEAMNIEMIDENGNTINTVPNDVIEDDSNDLNDADMWLQKIKANGPIIGDFSNNKMATASLSNNDFDLIDNNSTRSLADIKADKEYDKLMSSMENAMPSNNSFEKSLKSVMATKQNTTMTNFKGLTKPIVQSPSQISSNPMNRLFDMDWTMGAR